MSKKKILLVEDESELVGMIKYRLEINNYDVITAMDGQEALDLAYREKPDLIILDVMIPKVNGFKVCQTIKQDSNYPKVPIIIFTVCNEDSNKKMGQYVGADEYIVKPFDPKSFMEKVKKFLEKS